MGGDILPDQSFNGLHVPFVRMLLDRADCITSKSAFMDRALCKIGDYRNKIRRISWGINLSLYSTDRDINYLRQRWSIPQGDLVFLDPRVAQPFFNKHIILTSFARYLREGGPSATLMISEIFADPNYVDELKKRASDLDINDRVRFIGSIDHKQMPDYYALADITISVPISDGLPQTIYEALACGSFLILGDLPQYHEIIEDGVIAKLVPIGDDMQLVSAMHWAAIHPEIRNRAKDFGCAYVEKNANADQQALMLNDIYDELLSKRGHRRKSA
jgi:glycosyltransferase involved in cell wall biosynthesis